MTWTVHHLFDRLGHERIARELGRSVSAITAAVTAREIPAAWYFTILRLCREDGLSIRQNNLAALCGFVRLDDAHALGTPRHSEDTAAAPMNKEERRRYRRELLADAI